MKQYKLVYGIALMFCCSLGALADNYVIINQVMYDTPRNEQVSHSPYSNGEFIELYNGSTESVSLNGWYVKGDGATENVILPNMSVSSHSYLIIAYRHTVSPLFTLDSLFHILSGNVTIPIIYQNDLVLSNQGETITLYNSGHEIVDQVYYDGTSHVTKPDRLCASNPDTVSGDQCVSLHRTWVEFDEHGCVVDGTSMWKTDLVSFGSCQLAETTFEEHNLTGNQSLPIGQNYILTVSPLDPTTRVTLSDNGVSVSSGVRTRTTVQYYDELGRPNEKIEIGVTQDKRDLVRTIAYNGLGCATQQWKPVVQETDGAYVDVSTLQPLNSNNRPFTETLYEYSALNRIIGHKQPGESYSSHPSTYTYSVNDEYDNVRIYTVVRDSVLKTTGECYPTHTLYKTVVADEDGKAVSTFTDKLGRKIAEERAGYKTYYVYDDLGRLRYVIPPISGNKLNNGEYPLSNATLRAAAYCYKYDDSGNVIYKRLPGCEPQYMVYDQLGQLVLTQDGNQRVGNKWILWAYDSIGRNLYTAEIMLQQTHTDLIAFFRDKWQVEHYGNNPPAKSIPGTGYASTILGKNNLQLLTLNYYDDYDYLSRLSSLARQALRFTQESGYGLQHDNSIGLLTGTRVYNLSEEGFTAVSYYYDVKERVVQSRSIRSSDNYTTSISTEYLFDGSVAQQLTIRGRENDIVREHYRYAYDHAGRPQRVFYKLNNHEEIQLSAFSYDNYGHLVQNLLYNQQDVVSYYYDMRDRLNEVYNKHYSEKLFYGEVSVLADFAPHAQACYNGNIAAAIFQQGDSSYTFDYNYDAQNRLVEFAEETNGTTRPIEWYQYDARGNILRMQRYSGFRMMDDLSLIYQEEGNQLLSVRDNGIDGNLYGMIDYEDLHRVEDSTDMRYDANGNLIFDADRGISVIKYNILNLPDTIQFAYGGHQMVNLYDAMGRKYKSIIYTNLEPGMSYYPDVAHYTFDMDSVYYYVTDYDGNVETYYTPLDTTRRIYNSIGYFDSKSNAHYHYIKDHIGNISAVVDSEPDTLIQATIYYASGVPMGETKGIPYNLYMACGVQPNQNFGRDEQPYLYNGKEFVEAHGLNEYDSKARRYYATIMRTTTMDPLAEKYYHISPYAWCGNNTIIKIDEDGQYYFDWDDWCYRSTYTNDEVSWSEVLRNEFIEPRPLSKIGPLALVGEFVLGNGLPTRNFSQDDNFTQQFINDNDRLDGIYNSVTEAIFTRGLKSSAEDKKGIDAGKYNYSLGAKNLSDKIGIMAHDAANAAGRAFNKVSPFGHTVSTGNLAASVIGSFHWTWELEQFDSNGDAVVTFHVNNDMSAGSALRPATIGYTNKWRTYAIPAINGVFNNSFNLTGIMRTVRTNITWTTTIKNPNKQ